MRLLLISAMCFFIGCNAEAEIKGVERTQQNNVASSQPVDIVEGVKDLVDFTAEVRTSVSRLIEITVKNEQKLSAIAEVNAEVKSTIAGVNSTKNYGDGDSIPMRIAMVGSIAMGIVFLIGFFKLLRWIWPKRVAP